MTSLDDRARVMNWNRCVETTIQKYTTLFYIFVFIEKAFMVF